MLLRNEIYIKKDVERLADIIMKDFEKLELSGYLGNVVLSSVPPPGQAAKKFYTEFPFILQKGNTVFKGRIDRIIVEGETAGIYDYKTFPVKEKEMPELIDKYRFQMDIYRTAAEKILSLKARSYLLFTHMPLLIEV